MPEKASMNELIDAVSRAADLSNEQASAAVAGMMRFFASRLPSPLFGEFQDHLNRGGAEVFSSATSESPWA